MTESHTTGDSTSEAVPQDTDVTETLIVEAAGPIRCELGFYETTTVVRGVYASPASADSRVGTVRVGTPVCAKAFVNGRNYVLNDVPSNRWLQIQAQGAIRYIPGIFIKQTDVDGGSSEPFPP